MKTNRPAHVLGTWLFAFVIVMVCTTATFAGNTYWQLLPPATGDWFEPTNWNPGVPGAYDNAYIDNYGTAQILGGDAYCMDAYVGYSYGGKVELSLGRNLVHGNLILGHEAGSNGHYELGEGARLDVINIIEVGSKGKGTFVHRGTLEAAMRPIEIGRYAGSEGLYEMRGGRLIVGQVEVGRNGTGRFVQTGGEVSFSQLYMGSDDGTGYYEISGGSMETCDGLSISRDGTLKVIGPHGSIMTPGMHWYNGKLVSEITSEGLAPIVVDGGVGVINAIWEVQDSGAPFGRFTVITTTQSQIYGAPSTVILPEGPDWSWGIDDERTLWVEHIPEPATLGLLAVGTIALIRRRRR